MQPQNVSSERPPRRSRAESKEATKQALLHAGLIELVEHGLDAPSLDAICARAGYTRGAFYVHFKDREDFFVAVMDWALSGILAAVLGQNGAETDLRSAVSRFAGYVVHREWPVVGKYPIATHRLSEAICRSEQLKARWAEVFRKITESMAKLITEAQAKGEVKKNLDPLRAAESMFTMGIGAMHLQDTGVVFPQAQMTAAVMALLDA
ncbi:MAG TPA: TetR/AcrR family transcriptional regulator [Myxococcota bacterium]|nr:TetR/AcrR family transcriptional regulator [Myxococcota bacterium]